MKVLLINPPDSTEAMLGAGRYLVPRYEPLGLLYIAAVLREAGFEVALLDAVAEGLTPEETFRRAALAAPDIAGISVLTCSGAVVFDLGRRLRAALPRTLVALGNVHAAVFARQYLEHGCCDAVVHGEGERAMLALALARAGGRPPVNIPGVSTPGPDGRALLAAGPAAPPDLETLPPPARDLLDRRLYGLGELSNQSMIGGPGVTAMTLASSRGCPNRCTFCVARGGGQRFNTPDRVAAEMELLERRYGASYVNIVDPCFLSSRDRALEICAGIRRRGLKVRWGCDANIKDLDAGLAAELEAAGCYEIGLGLESGVERLLRGVRKDFSLARAAETIAAVKARTGIRLSGLFILGLPGETRADSLETIRFAKSLPLDMAQFSLLTPYPGSELFDRLSAAGELDTGARPDGSLDTAAWERFSGYSSFTGRDPAWVTPGRTGAELRALQKRAQREFYLRPRQVLAGLRRLRPRNLPAALRIALRAFF